jgi:hypothetical protein
VSCHARLLQVVSNSLFMNRLTIRRYVSGVTLWLPGIIPCFYFVMQVRVAYTYKGVL